MPGIGELPITFGVAIEAWCERAKKRMDRTARYLLVDMLTAVVTRTPVKRGWARGNWRIEINAMPIGVLATLDPSGTIAISEGTAKIMGMKAGDVVYIGNNAPHIRALEYGHSAQAPAGMVRITVAEFRQRLMSAAQRANNDS